MFDLQQDRCQENISNYVRDELKMDLCADSLFELCQKVYDITVAKYGHFILY